MAYEYNENHEEMTAATNQDMTASTRNALPQEAYNPVAHALDNGKELIRDGAKKLEADSPGICKKMLSAVLIGTGLGVGGGITAAGIIAATR